MFGQPSNQNQNNIFGASPQTGTSNTIFGGGGNPGGNAGGTSMFSNAQNSGGQGGGMFGGQQQNQQQQPQGTGGIFGGSSQNSAQNPNGVGFFGSSSSNNQTSVSNTGGMFGGATTGANTGNTGMFGAQNQTQNQNSGTSGMFGNQPSTSFGGNNANKSGFFANTNQPAKMNGTSWGVTQPQNQFPSIIANMMGGNKGKFVAVKSKNPKIDSKHLVKCITGLDQNYNFSKNELRIRFLLTGQTAGGVQQQQGATSSWGATGATGTTGNTANTNMFGGGNTNANNPTMFGSNNTSATTGSNMFGNTPTFGTGANTPNAGTSNNIFGGNQQVQQNQPNTSMFGGPSTTGTGGMIGGQPQQQNNSIFGNQNQTNSTTTGMFGATTTANPATSMFGGQPPTGGNLMFSNTGAQNNTYGSTTPTTTNNIFGGGGAQTGTTGMFANATGGASTPSFFGGASTTQTQQPQNNLFGGGTATGAPTNSLFNTPTLNRTNNTPATGGNSIFGGQPQQQQNNSLFNTPGNTSTPSFGLNNSTPNTGFMQPSTNAFGTTQNQPPNSLFGATTNQTAGNTGGFFGTGGTTPTNSLLSGQNTTNPQFGGQNVANTSSLFPQQQVQGQAQNPANNPLLAGAAGMIANNASAAGLTTPMGSLQPSSLFPNAAVNDMNAMLSNPAVMAQFYQTMLAVGHQQNINGGNPYQYSLLGNTPSIYSFPDSKILSTMTSPVLTAEPDYRSFFSSSFDSNKFSFADMPSLDPRSVRPLTPGPPIPYHISGKPPSYMPYGSMDMLYSGSNMPNSTQSYKAPSWVRNPAEVYNDMAKNLFLYNDPEDQRKKEAFFKKYRSLTPFDEMMEAQKDPKEMEKIKKANDQMKRKREMEREISLLSRGNSNLGSDINFVLPKVPSESDFLELQRNPEPRKYLKPKVTYRPDLDIIHKPILKDLNFEENNLFNEPVLREDLPTLPEGYSIRPCLDSLMNISLHELKAVKSVEISNKYGKVKFLVPINLWKKEILQGVVIEQDSIEIKDKEWDNKQALLTFHNFGNCTKLNDKDKGRLQRKMNKWLTKMNMKLVEFNEENGQLAVRI